MITIFATPKPFEGQTAVDQKNAIISWKLMMPDAQIILIGDDFGTQQCAKAMNICHAGGVKVNELGTPRLDSIFRIAQEKAQVKSQENAWNTTTSPYIRPHGGILISRFCLIMPSLSPIMVTRLFSTLFWR